MTKTETKLLSPLIDITGMSEDQAIDFLECYGEDIVDYACENKLLCEYEAIEEYLRENN